MAYRKSQVKSSIHLATSNPFDNVSAPCQNYNIIHQNCGKKAPPQLGHAYLNSLGSPPYTTKIYMDRRLACLGHRLDP